MSSGSSASKHTRSPGIDDLQTTTGAAPAVWLTPPHSELELFGLGPAERVRRSLPGSGRFVIAAEPPDRRAGGHWLVVRGDAVLDPRLLLALAESPDTVLVGRSDEAPVALAAHVMGHALPHAAAWVRDGKPADASVRTVGPDELVPPYDTRLRKRAPALATVARGDDPKALEWSLFRAAYKGVTDWVTGRLWPRPALHVVRACARLGVSPNLVTFASYGLVAGAFAAFLGGAVGPGLLMAWAMTFLDTVDGKLARVTLTSSRIGHVLDHGLDLVHPPFWWWAFGAGLLSATGGPAWLATATWICVGGYLAGRLLEGIFLAAFGFELHSYQRIDSRFRQITARRNPNLVLLSAGALAARPELGLLAVAAWTLFSCAFHTLRIAQAALRRARGGAVRPWEEDPAAS